VIAVDGKTGPGGWTQHEEIFNGVRLHYVSQGEGPLVLLLHGFPEFWYSWRYQLPALAAAGFRAVAPDMRGYNLSEKPPGIHSYHIRQLVGDTAGMIRALGGEDGAYLVGHDWGGVVAWHTASRHSDLVKKLVILNAPHPNRYVEVLDERRRQRLKSTYVGFFQLPLLPERMLTAREGALAERLMRQTGINPAHFTDADARHYRKAICQPGAATAALNYYRSMVRRKLSQRMEEPSHMIHAPTLLLWGIADTALHNANAQHSRLSRWVPDLRVEPLQASHWVQLDLPHEVNQKMVEFLAEGAE
jgi:epoxide hydrolase 4